jgi:hypothetical protein
MSATVDQEKCSGCGAVVAALPDPQSRVPCAACCSTARVIEVSISDSLEFHDSIAFKQKRPGYKKAIAEGVSGDSFFRTAVKWVHLERLIDRLSNHYREKVTDPKTGEVIHECDEPLDQHTGHGSAKPKKIV